MKFTTLTLLAVALLSVTTLFASDSKRTVEYYLTTPDKFEGQEITLDIAFVQPVKWKSPVPELTFFHATSMDRRDHKHGGKILVVVNSADAEKFARKYGTDFEGRRESDILKGTLLASPGGRNRQGKIWMVDTTGKALDLMRETNLQISEEGQGRERMGGGGPR